MQSSELPGLTVYLCNLDPGGRKPKVMGHAWDDLWQAAAQGTPLGYDRCMAPLCINHRHNQMMLVVLQMHCGLCVSDLKTQQ